MVLKWSDLMLKSALAVPTAAPVIGIANNTWNRTGSPKTGSTLGSFKQFGTVGFTSYQNKR